MFANNRLLLCESNMKKLMTLIIIVLMISPVLATYTTDEIVVSLSAFPSIDKYLPK